MKPYCTHQIFDDFDEFAESARNWSGDFKQLQPGRFQCEALQYIQGNIQFMHARMNQHIEQQGNSPKGLRTFAIPAIRHLRLNWLGTVIPDDSVLIFQPQRGLDCVSWNDFDMYTFSMPQGQINELCLELGCPSLSERIEQSDIIRCQPSALAELRRMFAVIDGSLKSSSYPSEQWIHEEIRCTLPIMLLHALAWAQETTLARPVCLRDNVIKQIKAYLDASPEMPPKIYDLCSRFHVSQRTLEYAFREHFGITPKRYLKTHRLNRVRKTLRQGTERQTAIADIANRFGFWHMGQFAADYRNLFSELPSETLCNNQ
jgi:AraC family ethanolamine operon transcriptional activator